MRVSALGGKDRWRATDGTTYDTKEEATLRDEDAPGIGGSTLPHQGSLISNLTILVLGVGGLAQIVFLTGWDTLTWPQVIYCAVMMFGGLTLILFGGVGVYGCFAGSEQFALAEKEVERLFGWVVDGGVKVVAWTFGIGLLAVGAVVAFYLLNVAFGGVDGRTALIIALLIAILISLNRNAERRN